MVNNLVITKQDNIQELIALQGKFRSWLELANGNFRFEPKTFHKAIEAIDRVIEIAKKQEVKC